MKRTKKPRYIGLLLLVLGLHIVVFPRGTGPELQIAVEWIADLDSDLSQPESARTDLLSFEIGDRFGYFSRDGAIVVSDRVLYGVSMSDTRFTNFSALPETVIVQDNSGRFLFSVQAAGYPVLFGQRTLLVHPDGATISEWDEDGTRLWEQEFQTAITAIDAAGDLSAVGRIDGRVTVVDTSGRSVLEHRSRAGRLSVVLAVAVSEDASLVAALFDLDPQWVVLFRREDQRFEVVAEHRLENQLRRPAVIRFVNGRHWLLWEQPDSVGVLALETGERREIRLNGSLSGFETVQQFGLIVALVRGDRESTDLLVLARPESEIPLLSLTIPGSRGFVRASGPLLFIAVEDRIVAYRLEQG